MNTKIAIRLIAIAILSTSMQAKEFTKDRFDLLLSTSITNTLISDKSGTTQVADQQAFPVIVKAQCSVKSMSFNLKNSSGISKTIDLYSYVKNLDKLYYKLLQAKNYDMLAKIAYFTARPNTNFSEIPNADNAYVLYDSFSNLKSGRPTRLTPFVVGLAYACYNNKSNKKITGMESLAYKDFILAIANNEYNEAKNIVNKVLKGKDIYKIYKDKLAFAARQNFGEQQQGIKITEGKYSNEIVYTVPDNGLKKTIKEAGLSYKEAANNLKDNSRECTKSSLTYTGLDFVYHYILDKNNPKDYIKLEFNFEDCLN